MTKQLPKPENYFKPIHPMVVDYKKHNITDLRGALRDKCAKTNQKLEGISRMKRDELLKELSFEKVRAPKRCEEAQRYKSMS